MKTPHRKTPLIAILGLFILCTLYTETLAQGIPVGPPPKKNAPTASTKAAKQKKIKPVKDKSPRNGYPLLTLQAGAGLNHYTRFSNNTLSTFDSRLLAGMFNGMVGFRYNNRPVSGVVGIWVAHGSYTAEGSATIDPDGPLLRFTEVETGLLVKNVWRLSVGYGGNSDKNGAEVLDDNYFTATTGFYFGPKNIKFHITTTALFSQQENRVDFRPALGLNLKFDFLRRR